MRGFSAFQPGRLRGSARLNGRPGRDLNPHATGWRSLLRAVFCVPPPGYDYVSGTSTRRLTPLGSPKSGWLDLNQRSPASDAGGLCQAFPHPEHGSLQKRGALTSRFAFFAKSSNANRRHEQIAGQPIQQAELVSSHVWSPKFKSSRTVPLPRILFWKCQSFWQYNIDSLRMP